VNIDQFYKDVSYEVTKYLARQSNGKYANSTAWIKAILLLLLYPVLYFVLLKQYWSIGIQWLLLITFGLVALLIVFNIGHDAVHGAFSKHKWVNMLLGYTFNLVGASAYSWKLKHNEAHHRYTNIESRDHDIEIDPFMRVSPSRPHLWIYRWQHYYWALVYMLFSLLIIFVADFLILFQEKKKGYLLGHPFYELCILLGTKAFYIFYIFWIPMTYFNFSSTEVFVGFITYHLINGLMIGLVFQPSHYFVESLFFDNTEHAPNMNWIGHQLQTTCDLSPNSAFLSHLIGALNVNVAHHMYPQISHVHYPALAKIIRKQCIKYGITYHAKSYYQGILSHVQLLKILSEPNQSKE
jgi:linoleoyl-CoA desaturase